MLDLEMHELESLDAPGWVELVVGVAVGIGLGAAAVAIT
jgi:hypothetical protein